MVILVRMVTIIEETHKIVHIITIRMVRIPNPPTATECTRRMMSMVTLIYGLNRTTTGTTKVMGG